ncbi:MAG: spermidine/putrescine ABC transporter substrate-binding protein [Actinobacteria bacterium]|nr:spermidine/putrescine ABC transporter substrate-binding protein [Actinomycetota bacterium]
MARNDRERPVRRVVTTPDGREGRAGGADIDRLMARVESAGLSRRGFLRAAVIAPTAAFLAACTRRVSTTTTTPPSTTAAPTGTGTPTTTPPPVLEDTLNIYNWAAYLNPESRRAFAREYDVTTTIDFYASNEELIAKLQGGATGYDIVAPTGYAVQIMIEEGLLFQLDRARLPNISHVDPKFLGLAFDPNNDFSVPKDWGTTGFMYLADKITEEPTTWAEFYELAPKYTGKYTVLDSAPEVVGSALKMHGFSYNTTEPGEVDVATDDLIGLKPHLAAITSSEYRQMMERGDTYMALGWNGDYFYVLLEQPSARYVIPSEGTEFWIDTWAIPASAPHPNLAMEWINWILVPEHQGRETSFTYYASPVPGAAEFIDGAIVNDPAIYPSDDVIANLEANDGNPVAYDLRTEAWTKFKSA